MNVTISTGKGINECAIINAMIPRPPIEPSDPTQAAMKSSDMLIPNGRSAAAK